MRAKLTAALLGATLLTSACATEGYGPGYRRGYDPAPAAAPAEGTAAGAVIGALGGCILGRATHNSCLGGAALGAVVGGAIGYYRDQRCETDYCGEREGVKVYYDRGCRAYFYEDRDRRQFWENGGPRYAGNCP